MSTEREPEGGWREPVAARVDPGEHREHRLRRSAQCIDEAENELKHDLAEAKETTEKAGHRLAGPLAE